MDPILLTVLGSYERISDYAHAHGYSQLERVRANGRYFWIKRHAYPGKQAGEVHALQKWGPQLGRTPEVVDWSPEPAVVILTEIEGVAPQPDDLAIWREAGEWLARMHAIENGWIGGPDAEGRPNGEPDTDPVAHYGRAIETRLRDGRDAGYMTGEEAEFIERAREAWLPALENNVPCAIHRDFGPRNWIARAEGGLAGVIDFEHAVWGSRAMDLGRLAIYHLDENPHQEAAFFEGYGPISPELKDRLALGRLMHAVGGLVFACRVRDEPFERMNRAALHRLMTL